MDISNSINDQLIAAMAMSTQAPAIIRPYFDPNQGFDKFYETSLASCNAASAEFKKWFQDKEKMLREINHIFEQDAPDIDSTHINMLRQFAQVLEKKAENNTVTIKRSQKKFKQLSAGFSDAFGSNKAAPVKAIFDEYDRLSLLEIDTLLDMAIAFRAIAGKYDPKQKVSFTANSVQDLDEYFASLEGSS